MSIDLLKDIGAAGLRVFRKSDLENLPSFQSYSATYQGVVLSHMKKMGEIISLGNGIYTLPLELLSGGPVHSFEIAMALAKTGAISHSSAMAYHQLTDQVFRGIYLISPREEGANRSNIKAYDIDSVLYNIMRVKKENYWGVKRIFLGEASFWVTDIERTLLDGLINPELCGGFREVIYAFDRASENISAETIGNYAQKISIVACKRLGWVLERTEILPELQKTLLSLPSKTFQKLDSSGPRRGRYNNKWMLLENI